jgi:serine/threonine protein kinase
MGTVWRARDELLQRDVAVKIISYPPFLIGDGEPAVGGGEAAVARATREARAASRLNHPGVVTVHDLIEADGQLSIVMELVAAPTLADVVARQGSMPPARVAAIGMQLVDVLEVAHAAGIVHRDVKPANVMLLPGDRTKLTDFGIATLAGDAALTTPGTTVGSPSFMAPEQVQGDGVGPACDWWGLAATLYFAVEGRPPYRRDGVPALIAALLTQPPDPNVLAGPLTPALTTTLVPDPAARPGAPVLRSLLRLATMSIPAAHASSAVPTTARAASDLIEPPALTPFAEPPLPSAVSPSARRPDRAAGRRRSTAALAALSAVLAATSAWLGVQLYRQHTAGPGVQAATSDPSSGAAAPVVGSGGSPSAGQTSSSADGGRLAPLAPDAVVDRLGLGSIGRDGLREVQPEDTPAPGQVLPAYTKSVTDAVGGYALAVPDWHVYLQGPTTYVEWQDTMFYAAFEVRSFRATDLQTRIRQDEARFRGEHRADSYELIRVSPSWTYAGRSAVAWDFRWTLNGERLRGRLVAFTIGSRTYTVLYRSADVWWYSGGSDVFPTAFEAGFHAST